MPVPPFATAMVVPFQTPVVIVPTVARADAAVRLASVSIDASMVVSVVASTASMRFSEVVSPPENMRDVASVISPPETVRSSPTVSSPSSVTEKTDAEVSLSRERSVVVSVEVAETVSVASDVAVVVPTETRAVGAFGCRASGEVEVAHLELAPPEAASWNVAAEPAPFDVRTLPDVPIAICENDVVVSAYGIRYCVHDESPVPPSETARSDASVNTPAEEKVLVDRKSTRLNSSHSSISYAVF